MSHEYGCFFAPVEYGDPAVFHRRVALDALGERRFDAHRPIGQPTKRALSDGRSITTRYRGKLEPVIADLDLPNPVLPSYSRDGCVKPSGRDHLGLRTEATSNHTADCGVAKSLEPLRQLREALAAVTAR